MKEEEGMKGVGESDGINWFGNEHNMVRANAFRERNQKQLKLILLKYLHIWEGCHAKCPTIETVLSKNLNASSDRSSADS